jgi:hypothetical protein
MRDRYKLENGGSVLTCVWWRPASGRFSVELWIGMRVHPYTDMVLSGDDGKCYLEWIPLLRRCQTSQENFFLGLGQSFPERGKCGGQYKRELILPCHRASF